jgi:hypothetical protein
MEIQKISSVQKDSSNIAMSSNDRPNHVNKLIIQSIPKKMSSNKKQSAQGKIPTGLKSSSVHSVKQTQQVFVPPVVLTEEQQIQQALEFDMSQCQKTFRYYSKYSSGKIHADFINERKRGIGYMNYKNFVGKSIFPASYVPYKTSGDGLCFIHSAFRSVFLFYYSQDDTGSKLRQWLRSLRDYMSMHMPSLIADIETRDIVISGDRHIEEFIFDNYELMIAYGVNIMRFIARNWYNQDVHVPNSAYVALALTNGNNLIPSFRMSNGVSGNNSVYAVDNHGRNFVMSILGIRRVCVLQDNIQDKRYNAPIVMQSILTTDGNYSGFDISSEPGTTANERYPEIFVGFSDTLSVSMFSLNTNHYDILLTIKSGNVASPVEVFGSDMLPPIAPTSKYTGDYDVIVGFDSVKSAGAKESTDISIVTSESVIEITICGENIDYESMTDEMLYESLLMCDDDNIPDLLLAYCISRGISK